MTFAPHGRGLGCSRDAMEPRPVTRRARRMRRLARRAAGLDRSGVGGSPLAEPGAAPGLAQAWNRFPIEVDPLPGVRGVVLDERAVLEFGL